MRFRKALLTRGLDTALFEDVTGQFRAKAVRVAENFGTCKRSYGLRRMRWRGLTEAGPQVRLRVIAYNLHRTSTISQERSA